MDKERTEFLARNVVSEMMELLATTHKDPFRTMMSLVLQADMPKQKEINPDETETKALQMDACLDANYYIFDTCVGNGMNLNPGFDAVHKANMSKRFSDGTFHKTSFGKVDKPPGFVGPNIVEVIQDQEEYGSW